MTSPPEATHGLPLASITVWVLPAAAAPAALGSLAGSRPVQRTPAGKPWLAGGPYFNLTHSGDRALLAVCADTPVGVDLEAHRRFRNPAGLIRRMCSDREAAALAGAATVEDELLRLWVRKEAVAKAEGGGLTTALGGVDVLDPLVRVGDRPFFVHDLVAPPGFLAALAWPIL